MGLNNNGPGRPLARSVVGFLGRAVGRGLFDDPYFTYSIFSKKILILAK